MKIWAKTEEFSEGKYLVVRRDGTTPHWPHFVLGGDDPSTPAALRAYADDVDQRGLDPAYGASIRELADDFAARTGGKADPDAGPHRKDLPLAIAMMRRQTDVATVATALAELLEALIETDLYREVEAGCEGDGPIVRGFVALAKQLPQTLIDYLDDDDDSLDPDEA